MEFLSQIFNILLYQPVFNLLILIYYYLPIKDFGLAIIILTIIFRIILFPLFYQSIKTQKLFEKIQPEIKKIQQKHKNNLQLQGKEIMDLYQRYKINPLQGFLPLFLQLPILIALYRVVLKGFRASELSHLYSFMPHPGTINPLFLGFINLSQPNLFLAILAGFFQFYQTKKMSQKKKEEGTFSHFFQKKLILFFPLLTIFILFKLPSALALYWVVISLFSISQQYFILKENGKS